MTNFEKITQSPEGWASSLLRSPCASHRGTREFQRNIGCGRVNCDAGRGSYATQETAEQPGMVAEMEAKTDAKPVKSGQVLYGYAAGDHLLLLRPAPYHGRG